jgi:hypothetical protein
MNDSLSSDPRGVRLPDQNAQARARHAVQRALADVRPLVTLSRDGLVIVALERPGARPKTDYLTFDQATQANAIEVRELGSGTVPEVEAITREKPVLLLAGDTIVGGKQNRVINITIWLKAAAATHIPVSCLEAHRWNTGSRFGAGRKVDYTMRSMVNRMVGEQVRAEAAWEREHGGRSLFDDRQARRPAYRADQGAIWAEISDKESRAGMSSPTAALHDLYEAEAGDLDRLVRAFPCPAGAAGMAVGIGGRIVGLDLFDAPSTMERQWTRLVESAASAFLDHERAVKVGALSEPRRAYPDDGALGRMLDRASAALDDAAVEPSVGEGVDVRFAGPKVHGSALIRDGSEVHAEVFRDDQG